MQFEKTILTKDGKSCLLRGSDGDDAEEFYRFFQLTHGQTDYLLSYPEETTFTVDEEQKFLADLAASDNAIEICAIVDGAIIGSAGFSPVSSKLKLRHRAEFGVTVEKSFWSRGIGRALTEACINLARQAGYLQLELDAVADNLPALTLYQSVGFREYGRNPRGFRTKDGRWQELVLMRLELDA